MKNYKYVAIGGIRQEIGKKRYKYFKLFLDEAHKHNCRVHGLGFTRTDDLESIPFDSVDSTTYLNDERFCEQHRFDGKKIITKNTGLHLKQKLMQCSDGY